MSLIPGQYVFCEKGRILDICKNVEGIRIDNREYKLEGYQIYLVEQWAIERNREVATAVSFTGDPVHKIQVVAITIEHPDVSCPRLEKVFEELREEKSRPKDTPHGQLFVTNLSLFASSLNIVLVPHQGDFDLYQPRFYLNLNLRRMGCSGRSALTSKSPSGAQREKFNQLYKISDSTDFEETVIKLVTLVQNCLYIFGLFNIKDVDGLLCDATERGLDTFYKIFLSSKFQKFSPDNNALDPSVLAGMFSELLNVRSKLQHLVNNVPKDPFAEPEAFLSAVKTFQAKKPDLKARYLDLKTVEAITAAYQSSFNPQGLKVHKVLKSKIEDFSGMTAVNPEGETTDLEVFAKHIHMDSLKQVWRGKPKHKPDMADALVNGDWLTGGKELGKSLVRGLAKTTRETKNASQSLKSITGAKNRQSLLLPKGKPTPVLNIRDGTMTEEMLVTSALLEPSVLKSDDERNDGEESDEVQPSTTVASSTVNFQGSEEETPATFTAEAAPQSKPVAAIPSLDTLALLFSQKPEPPGPPEITAFYLERRNDHSNSGSSRKRSRSLTALGGQERLLGCRTIAAKSTGAIPGVSCGPRRKLVRHPAHRKRSQSYSSLDSKEVVVSPLRSLVIECDTQSYYSYQLLKEKEENLKSLHGRMQTMENELSTQLKTLMAVLEEQTKEFQAIECEANEILNERRVLLDEVREKEHATQRSVYHLEGMVGKLVEMRDFTDAFFNRIAYLDTKLPVSHRRLALWMDKLQKLQSQWFDTIIGYMKIYAPSGIRNRFSDWEKRVQHSAMEARELRGQMDEAQLGGGSTMDALGSNRSTAAPEDNFSTPTSSKSIDTDPSRHLDIDATRSLVEVGSHSVMPESLKTEGDDAKKDVSHLLHRKVLDHGDGCLIKDTDSPLSLSSTPNTSLLSSSSSLSSSQAQESPNVGVAGSAKTTGALFSGTASLGWIRKGKSALDE